MNVLKSVLNLRPLKVCAGPFEGTKCRFTGSGDGVVAKLAGTYERELHEAFASIIAQQPDLIVDVGAAEGFYVAALARAVPRARVCAYEAKEAWHARLAENLRLNEVESRCEIHGLCGLQEFRSLAEAARGAKMFLLMDIEGAEFQLLDESALPLLSKAELLIELHEPTTRHLGDDLIARLGKTHAVKTIWQQDRKISDIDCVTWRCAMKFLPGLARRLDEGRIYRMRWLWAQPLLDTQTAGDAK